MPTASAHRRRTGTEERGRFQWSSALLAVLSGLLLTAAFPPGDLGYLVWIALIPLLMSIEGQPPYRAFQYGVLAGFIHYLTLLYWIVVALGHYGNLPIPAAIIPLVLLCLYLSLYPAVFSFLTRRFHGLGFPIFAAAAFWVGLEYLRAKLLSGFPWSLMGHTQYRFTTLIQITDICGVYGLSFLVLLGNGLVYRLFLCRETLRRRVTWESGLTVVLVGLSLLYGTFRIPKEERNAASSPPITAAIVQGNIDQSRKWDPRYQEHTLSVYEELTRSALRKDPALVVWPETAVPFFFQDHPLFSQRVLSLAKASGATLVFGSPAYETIDGKLSYRNRAYVVPTGNQPVRHYDKLHLVPFGEYVPLKRLLFFVDRLVPAAGDFSPGPGMFPIYSTRLSMGILICFEAIFPELSREAARKGANILINITNDAWFGMTSAPHQHLSMSVFRAVENKMPLIRAANSGISAVITPHGEIIARSGLFEREVLTTAIPIPEPRLTIYARFGDLFALGCLSALLAGAVLTAWEFKRSRSAPRRAGH